MNNREIGNKLENYVVGLFTSIGINARRSPSSGARGCKSDILCNQFYIECKKKNQENFNITRSVWQKLKNAVPLHSTKIPLYINENKHNDRLVTLELEDFIRLIHEKK